VFAMGVLGLCSACASPASRPAAARPARRFVVAVQPRPSADFSEVEYVDARGRVVRTLARKVWNASLSPNGRLVALEERSGIYVERINGSWSRPLVRWNRFAWDGCSGCGSPFSWSPDSKQLLVAVSNSLALAVFTVATGAERMLPVLPGKPGVAPMGWSGPAHEILFGTQSGEYGYTERLFLAPPTGASPRRVYFADDSDEGAPYASLSPDGKWIAYTAEGFHSDPYFPFGVIDVASGKTTLIDNIHDFVQTPVWAPDSSRFAVGLSVFSNRGVRLYSTGMPSATPVAWTRAGLYLTEKSKGSTKLIFVPTGQNSAETLFSLPRGAWSVQPLG
jgi:hypothetical protein